MARNVNSGVTTINIRWILRDVPNECRGELDTSKVFFKTSHVEETKLYLCASNELPDLTAV